MASTKPGMLRGSPNIPEPKASGKNAILATASAALVGNEYAIARPIRVNGTTASSSAPSPSTNCAGVTVASVRSAPINVTGTTASTITIKAGSTITATPGPDPARTEAKERCPGETRG